MKTRAKLFDGGSRLREYNDDSVGLYNKNVRSFVCRISFRHKRFFVFSLCVILIMQLLFCLHRVSVLVPSSHCPFHNNYSVIFLIASNYFLLGLRLLIIQFLSLHFPIKLYLCGGDASFAQSLPENITIWTVLRYCRKQFLLLPLISPTIFVL